MMHCEDVTKSYQDNKMKLNTYEITCQKCKREFIDSHECDDYDEHVCDYCNAKFRHSRSVDVTYTTEIIEE